MPIKNFISVYFVCILIMIKITPEVNGFILNGVNEVKAHMGQNNNQTKVMFNIISTIG